MMKSDTAFQEWEYRQYLRKLSIIFRWVEHGAVEYLPDRCLFISIVDVEFLYV